MDAPWHYHPTMDGGVPAITVDEIPLEWCYQPGVKLDFRHFDDGYVVKPTDIEAELNRISHRLCPLDIVLVNTAAGHHYGHEDYLLKGCGFGRDSTLWLTERGVRVVGTDAWSWDAPFAHTARRWQETGDPSIIWEGHKAGMERAVLPVRKARQPPEPACNGFRRDLLSDQDCFSLSRMDARGRSLGRRIGWAGSQTNSSLAVHAVKGAVSHAT